MATETGDEEGPVPGSDGTAADVREDSLDVTHVRYALTPTNLVTTLSIARLTDAPVLGTGQGYASLFTVGDQITLLGAYRDSQSGPGTIALLGGNGMKATPHVQVSYDKARNTVTLTVSRRELLAGLGRTSSSGLVLAGLGAQSDDRLNGSGLYSADSFVDHQSALSFRACDKALARR